MEIDEYVWSTSDKVKMRSLSLWLIESIVKKYGGTIRKDLLTNTLNVSVPKDKEQACAMEIEEKVNRLCQ